MTERSAQRIEVQKPHTNSNFLVDLGYGDPNSFNSGFCEVIFPEFRIGAPKPVADTDSRSELLTLKRGVTGTLDLYEWWNKARKGKAPKARTVKITLLAEDHSTVVFTWYFRQARPVRLSYSSLNAMLGTVLIESIELAFDSMEMR
jgi:T4-like virus tail tube protein gp19